MKWIQPVYAAPVLTGIAGIGAVLVADHITKWHILVSVILAVSVAISIGAVARAEADAQRNRGHLDTLLRSMELPYFIIDAITGTVRSIAKSRDWVLTRQENFVQETVYEFEANGGQRGRLLVSEQEFKDLWILDDADRRVRIERRLFEPDFGIPPATLEEHAEAVVREAISEHMQGPHGVTQRRQPDGTRIYEVRTAQATPPLAIVKFSPERFIELLAMVPPLRRYHELAEEVRRAFEATAGA